MNPANYLLDPGDGGKSSRKWLTALLIIILIFASNWAPIAAVSTTVGGLLVALSIYIGGNVANKFVLGKANSSMLLSTVQPSSPSPGEEPEE